MTAPAAPAGPVVLVGNRMLGIMAVAGALVAVLPVADRFGPGRFGLAVVLAAFGLLLLVRRVELHRDEVRWRTVARLRRCRRGDLVAVDLDHRFLRFRAPGRQRVRIEVPAELRPEVRTWVEARPVDRPRP